MRKHPAKYDFPSQQVAHGRFYNPISLNCTLCEATGLFGDWLCCGYLDAGAKKLILI